MSLIGERPGRLIRTPDQRLRVFISSTLGELRAEREAVRSSLEALRLTPVMFELGARPHPPRELYRAYLEQSHVFLGIYGSRYGWVAPGEEVSGLEDEYRLAGHRPRLLYIKTPAPDRESRLERLIAHFADDDQVSYKRYASVAELSELVRDDLAVLLSETFESSRPPVASSALDRRQAQGTIPAPVTDLFGRETLVADVLVDLRRSRLVTLTGVGGIGKTRVATEVVRRVHDAGTEAWFISLEASASSDRALRTIVGTVGSRVEGDSTALDTVVSRLRGRSVLLCLDNLEQIPDTAELVLGLLQRLPELTLLASSRRALRLQAEHEIRVDPLNVPGSMDAPSAVGETAAVQLFLSRARTVRGSFTLTGDNAATVAEITRRLDGLPLAIELAAARTRILVPEQILKRLRQRVDVLSGGGPDLPERQRAMRTTLDWSHDLLDPAERAVFARLGIFADGWTLDSAQAVIGDLDAVEGLASMLDNSLIAGRFSSSPGVEPRFGMLGTVRAYALERLDERGEVAESRARHLDYFRRLGERAQPSLCGPGQQAWLARLDPERANLREAVAWALDSERYADVVELTWDVIVAYFVRDAVDEPDSWLGRLKRRGPALDRITTAKFDSLHALTRIHHGDYTDVHRLLDGPLEVFRRNGMDFEAAVTLHQWGFVRFAVDDDVAGALAALAKSAALFDQLGHDWGVSLVEAMRGSLYAATGALGTAREHLTVALARARGIDCEPQQTQALVQLAMVELADGRAAQALSYLRESAGLLRRGRYLNDGATCLVAAAALASQDGRTDLARQAVRAASDVRRRLGVSPWPTLAPFIADVEHRVGAEAADADEVGGDPFDLLDTVVGALRTN